MARGEEGRVGEEEGEGYACTVHGLRVEAVGAATARRRGEAAGRTICSSEVVDLGELVHLVQHDVHLMVQPHEGVGHAREGLARRPLQLGDPWRAMAVSVAHGSIGQRQTNTLRT